MIRNCYGPNVCILLRIVCWNPNPTTWWYLEVRPLDIVRCRWIQEDAAKSAKSLQLCPTLCDPIDASPPGSPVPGILQARTLEWGVITNNRLTALLRRDQKSSRFSPFYEVAVRRQPLASQEGHSSGTKSACTLILGIQSPELWEISVYSLRHPVTILLQKP